MSVAGLQSQAMSGSHPHRVTATLGVAGSGLLLGHWLAYALGTPDATARDELLHATGHSYLPYATQVALLAGVIGLVGLFLARLHRRERLGSFAGNVVRLAALQSGAFLAMEVGERLLTGAPLHDLTHGPLLVIGLGVQAVLAVVGALVLRFTERAAEAVETVDRAIAGFMPRSWVTASIASGGTPRRPASRAACDRAPPLLP